MSSPPPPPAPEGCFIPDLGSAPLLAIALGVDDIFQSWCGLWFAIVDHGNFVSVSVVNAHISLHYFLMLRTKLCLKKNKKGEM